MNVKEASSSPKIIVFSDYICPFCFIGKSRIDKLRKEFPVAVEWRNMEIHPETALEGIPRTKIDQRFYNRLWLNVERLAQESGVELKPPAILSNSSLALIASEYAKKQGRHEAFHDAVFRAYWQEGKNIGDIKVLQWIAKGVGLDSTALIAYIKEGDWEGALDENSRLALEYGVSGVPTFVIDDEIVVGAQPYEVIREAYLRAQVVE